MRSNNIVAITRRIAATGVGVLLALILSPRLQAQAFTSGGTGALGSFTNPLSVTDTSATPKTCTYNLMQIDMALGTVKVRPFVETNGASSCNTTLVDITSQFPTFPASGGFPDGVFEFTDFTFRTSVAGTRTDAVTLQFLTNAENTPVWIRATGDVTINSSQTIFLDGSGGTLKSGTGGMNPGKGGLGGPGGFRGGDGGNGGLVPTDGARGLGPGGGAGGVVSGTTAGFGATFLATNTTVAGTVIPAGNDLLLILRGGSGGGGGAGSSTGGAGNGGGGGGGAILIAASGTITVNGTIDARGIGGACCTTTGNGGGGSGGAIRLIASTIAGAGPLNVGGNTVGLVRLEAISITYSGGVSGTLQASNVPGGIVLPTDVPAYIRFLKITDSSNPTNTVTLDPLSQATTGRTGAITSPDVTMLNPGGVTTTSVTVELVAGPNTSLKPFPAGKTVTLAVGGLDTSEPGGGINYTAPITCSLPPPADCTATVSNVALPRGLSYMSAFTVVNLLTDGQLARMFPREYEGEAIESVRIQTSGQETEYVLIARSGREFPFRPGR